MKLFKIMTIAALGLGVAGCSSVETVSRNAPLSANGFDTQGIMLQRDYTVQEMNFIASNELQVSEGNGYYPFSDVVWRGDPVGDRLEQIGALFQEAKQRNDTNLTGETGVVMDIELVRFHGVTERTRFSVGGVYNIIFNLTLRNKATGEIIEQPRRIEANLAAPGGIAALMLEQRGQTEKVRVTDFLTQVLKDELTGTYEI